MHLAFDTIHELNSRPEGHGVRVHFASKPREGGADARIAALLREEDPAATHMVVGSDRRHVWTDAEEYARPEGAEVDLVQIEMLARYSQALDDMENRHPAG